MLRNRILSGVIGGPILLGLALLDGYGNVLAVLLFTAAGAWELFGMFQAAGHRPVVPLGLAMTFAFVVDAAMPESRVLAVTLALGGVGTASWLMLRADWSDAVTDWALTFAPAVYIGGLIQFFVPLRAWENGVFWVLTVLACTWTCDIMAFFVGRAFGRTKLAPRISPGKSVEGAWAGVTAAMLAGVVAATIGGYPPLRLAGLGLTIGVCAVFGDLIESFIKRQCGAKDSGVLVPGHGGILDRMDSILLAGAGAYFFLAVTA